MSKVNKILLAVFGIIALFLILNLMKNKSNQSALQEDSSKNKTIVSPKVNSSLQENEGGNVTVTVKPKVLKIGEKPVFELEFNTHTVDLNFDISQLTSLVDENGNDLNNAVWSGSGPGGHHRSGTLTFNTVLAQTKYVELVIKNVSEVPERKFKWNL